MEFLAIGSVLSSVLLLSMTLLVIYNKLDVVFFALIYLLVSIIILVLNDNMFVEIHFTENGN